MSLLYSSYLNDYGELNNLPYFHFCPYILYNGDEYVSV